MVCAGPPLRLRRRKWKVKIMDVIIRKQVRTAGLIYLALLVTALALVSGQSYLSVFAPAQLDALAYFFLRLHDRGITIASIFWGLWLFPFGLLAIRSGFIPRVFGWLLLVAGAAYLASAFTTLVLPAYGGAVGQVASLLELAEVPIILWMVVRGLWRPRGTAVAAG